MGTNYYAHVESCPECGRPQQEVHIGKQSARWKFLFRSYAVGNPIENVALTSFKQWNWFLEQSYVEIFDEYGEEVAAPIFLQEVVKRQVCASHTFTIDGQVYPDSDGYNFDQREFS